MQCEPVCDNFENALNSEEYCEDEAGRADRFISLRLFISIIVVVGGKKDRIQENYQHHEAVE